MIQDEEYELLVTTPERIKALGFKPQKEILTNHILPYASELDAESIRFLDQVKTNLAKSVMLREMKPACGVWSSRLMKYIRLYGLKFGKDDHIALIKLAFELILIPDLEPCKIHKFSTMFLMLIKKRYLISPEELTLPWRPLYDLGKKIFDKSATQIGMYHYLTSLEGSFISVIKSARAYFDINATKEILEEFLPQINPWSTETHMFVLVLAGLPITLPPEKAEYGHKLWFDKLMTLWDTCYNSQCGVSELIMLFGGLAKKNPGSVDWSPYVPTMFTRFLHALNLPVGYKDTQISRSQSIDMKQVATWIVWSICPDGVVLKHLRSFLAGIDSYLQSANSGRWSFKLRDLLKKLAKEFLSRVRREREKRFLVTWENNTPDSYKLREEDITEFVNIVLEPTIQGVYSRSGSLDVTLALQNLALLRPAIVVPPLLEKLRTSLTSLTEPHRVTVAMSAVAAVARPLLRGPDADYPEGPTHVIPFLMAVLPGLDPNDLTKTVVSLHFILVFSWMVPLIDCSSAHEYWSDLTEEELLVCEATAQIEDFVLIFLDKIFALIESSVMEHVRLDTKESDAVRSKNDAILETALSAAANAVLMQCSPKIFKEALRKFKAFAMQTTFETNVSGSIVGALLRVFTRVEAESTLAAFMPQLCEELDELLATDETLHEENPPRDLVYRLVLLANVVGGDGVVLLKYMPQILKILDRALKLHANYALSRACEVLSQVLETLSSINLKEWKSSPKDFGEAPQKWLPIREWGSGCLLRDSDCKWHVPNAEEAECAQMLLDRYMKPEIKRLRQWMSGEREMCRERRLRCFYVIHATLSCSKFLPSSDEEPVILMESQVPSTSIPFTNGVRYKVTLDGENVRVAVTRLLLDVQARMLADKSDDTRGLEMLIQLWERIVVLKTKRGGIGLEGRLRLFSALEQALDGKGGAPKRDGSGAGSARLRMLVADAARLQDEARADLLCEAGITPSALQALHALTDLSINTYTSVRLLAQIRLYWMLGHYPYSYRALVPRLAHVLAEGGADEEAHARRKGALYVMLGPRTGPLAAKQDWEVVRALWPAVLTAPLSEKPSIMRLEQAFCDTLHRHFPTVNTRLTISDAAVEAAKKFFTEDQLKEPHLADQISKSVERETAASNRTEKLYFELIEELVDIAEAPNVQWRRLELAVQMVVFAASLQSAYPARAVRLAVRSLLHDNIAVRRLAHRLTHYALKQRKRKLNKIPIDPYLIAGLDKPAVTVPGYRKDLEWAMWSPDRGVPETDEDWEKPWLRNPLYGFYCWPQKILVAAPSSEQELSIDRSPEDMEEGERYIYEFFNDDSNVDKLVAFLTVEEKKGKDKFSGIRFCMFRMLFAQFGPRISSKFLSRALRCAADPQEAVQRFAAEVSAAGLRAPRYWPREPALATYTLAMEVISAGLGAVTPETMTDWGTCVATGVEKLEPRRGAGVLRALLELCAPPAHAAPGTHTSFLVCARLYALQGVLSSLKWRIAPLASELLQRLEATNFIQHPYQNVRETVGSLLMSIFDMELVFPGGEGSGGAPRLADFLASVKPRLAALYDENGDIVIKASPAAMQCARDSNATGASDALAPALTPAPVPVATARLATPPRIADLAPQVDESNSSPAEGVEHRECKEARLSDRLDEALRLAGDAPPAPEDHARALNLLTTVLRCCMGVVVRGVSGNIAAQYQVVGTACAGAARGTPLPQDELPRAAAAFLAALALAPHPPHALAPALRLLDDHASGRSWWTRLACLEFAQPLLFYSLPLMCAETELAVSAEQFALKYMQDARLEVRESAAKLLTGLMHCCALVDEERTVRALTRRCGARGPLERHCGVLGLCAYLASRPYGVGPRLGAVLAELWRHTSAPDPVPATIRRALADFRRTHQDDWPAHRANLSPAELDLLADLTSPPSYCA